MNIQIDTNKKILKLQESVNLGEFMENLPKLFPNNEWKEYTLETNVDINWSNPIVIERRVYDQYPLFYLHCAPWYTNSPVYVGDVLGTTGTPFTVTIGDNISKCYTGNDGIYNVSIY